MPLSTTTTMRTRIDILSLPPEVTQYIYQFCSMSCLTNLAACSKRHHESVQNTLWRTVSIPKDKIQTRCLPTHILDKLKFTSDLKLCDITSKTFFLTALDKNNSSCSNSKSSLITALNCKNIFSQCNGFKLSKLCIKTVATDRLLGSMAFKFRNLRELTLENCKSISELGWEKLGNLQFLRSLSVQECVIADDDLKELSRLKRLVKLRLVECDRITDEGMENVGRLSHLEDLCVSSNRNITAHGLESLVNLTNLVDLDLSFSTVNDYVIYLICSSLRKLQKLDISLCSDVTDRGLLELISLSATLEQVYMQENIVSVAVLDTFCQHTGMVEVRKHHLCDSITLKKVVKSSSSC